MRTQWIQGYQDVVGW